MKNKLEQLDFSNVRTTSPYVIKNFILSNSNNKPNFEHPFSFNGIVFVLCLKGEGRLRIDLKEYNSKENSMLTILPNQIVEPIDNSDDFFIELLAFSSDYLVDIFVLKDFNLPGKISQSPMLNISEKDIQNLLKYHSFIIEIFNNKKESIHFELIIKGLLHSLLMELVIIYTELGDREVKRKTSRRREDIVKIFLELLKDHYKEGRSASYYADKMFITPKYLSATLKKVTGRSINAWIEDAVILGTKILLKSTNLTILQISEELNFPNSSYFNRFFKKNTGITPGDYRELIQ